MQIPKKLILYKASRHKENFPSSLKYGYYSDKLFTPIYLGKAKQSRNFGRKYQQKLVQELHLKFFDDGLSNFELLKTFNRFSRIKKCSIYPLIHDRSNNERKDLGIRVFKRLFRTLKRIKHIEMQSLDFNELQNDPKTFKALVLLTGLESLTFYRLIYSQNTKHLKPLLKVMKVASQRKSWPKFKSLKVRPFYPEDLNWNREKALPLESLKSLLEFLKGLKACGGNMYKCLDDVQLTLPYCPNFNSEQAATISEISKLVPSIKSIEITEFKYSAEVLQIFQRSKALKRVSFRTSDNVEEEEEFDLGVLNKIPGLQELELTTRTRAGTDLLLYSKVLGQMQTVTNLTSFSFDISGGLILTEELKTSLAGVISSLTKLKSLKLNFWSYSRRNYSDMSFRSLWLGDLFEAIGKRNKLQQLSLSFSPFNFDGLGKLFLVFCQSLKKLKQLTELHLEFVESGNIGDKEIGKLCQSLRKLTKLQELNFRMNRYSGFQKKSFILLLDCFANSIPVVSRISLTLGQVKITSQAYQLLLQTVQRKECLNWIRLWLEGDVEAGIDLKTLKCEMNKTVPGEVYFNSQNL